MSPPTVWFNKHLSNTWEILALLREARSPGEFRILCTHPRGSYAGRHHADAFEKEPVGLGDDAYVEHCLGFARRHGVRLFVPGRKVLPIVRAAGRFAVIGTDVLGAGDAEAVALVNDKGRTYAALAGGAGIEIPEYAVVNNLAGFDAAWARLRPRHALCYKPAVSVFGIGFRIVIDEGTAPGPYFITHDDARREMGVRGRFRDLLLMQYLPGPERSVDCLAWGGRLVRCVVRRKEEGGQVIEDEPRLTDAIRTITARLRLSGLFNVQFRDGGGRPCLLEINPRMSGGLPMACKSGLLLPLWAIRLALGTATPNDVPAPRTGIWVPQPPQVASR